MTTNADERNPVEQPLEPSDPVADEAEVRKALMRAAELLAQANGLMHHAWLITEDYEEDSDNLSRLLGRDDDGVGLAFDQVEEGWAVVAGLLACEECQKEGRDAGAGFRAEGH